ncbi:phosphatase PAP2 family protein [Sneathiella limimaris]|uniref:phosphatase PAP2 family protein n=1 Tax=Sneathiella limimaris TaxID=1964213 RepID=UPI00146F5D0C|nr:phosphatase PAP2 family protein [Sneathiella limimaris]
MLEEILRIDILALQAFAEIRNPVFDGVFWVATELGHESFLMLFGAIGFWFVDKDVFRRALLMLLIAALLNSVLKEFFALPRPIVTALYEAEGYSFPSGHSQTAAAFWGWIAFEYRKRRILPGLLIGLAGLVALSRPYLGVHHFHDVAGGLILGFLQVGIFSLLLKGPNSQVTPLKWSLAIGIGLLISVTSAVYFEHPDMKKLATVLSALIASWLVGVLLEQKFVNFTPPKAWPDRILTLLVGFIILILLWRGLKPAFQLIGFEGYVADYLRYLVTGLWFAVGLPHVSMRYLRRSTPSLKT